MNHVVQRFAAVSHSMRSLRLSSLVSGFFFGVRCHLLKISRLSHELIYVIDAYLHIGHIAHGSFMCTFRSLQ